MKSGKVISFLNCLLKWETCGGRDTPTLDLTKYFQVLLMPERQNDRDNFSHTQLDYTRSTFKLILVLVHITKS